MAMEFYQIAITLNLFMVILMGFSCTSQCRTFYVGGKDGWVADPSENYNHWAERIRFQVNDSLIFKYEEGLDSVLEVSEADFYRCNKGNPTETLKDGESEFKFQRSGPFHFISGYSLNCEKGQKLLVVVMFPRGGATTHKAPSPVAKPATPPSPHSPSPSPSPRGVLPVSPSPSPQAKSPAPAPYKVAHDHDHLSPAPAPSAASVSGGGLISSLLGCSITVSMLLLSCLF